MTQAMVDQMPKTSYTPAISNQNKVPVKFYALRESHHEESSK